MSDSSVIEGAIARVLDDNDDMVQGYLGGKDKLFGALMGTVMKELKGQGNPQIVKEILTRQLEAKRS